MITAAWYQAHWQTLLLLQALGGTYLFAYALKCRPWFWLRLALSAAAGMGSAELLTRFVFGRGFAGEMITISALYLILIGIVCLCNEVLVWTAMFVVSSGYMVQNIASSLKVILRWADWIDGLAMSALGVLLLDLVCYGGVYLAAYFLFRPYTRQGPQKFGNKIKTIFSIVVLLICAGMTRLVRLGGDHSGWIMLADRIYQILCGCFILLLQYGLMERTRLAQSVEAMRELVHQQHVQYEASRESAQLVNEKYHDLKQLLAGFRGRMPAEQLGQLERHVGSYDTFVRTGSDVLDVILSEKRSLCAQRGVLLTCYVHGEALDFVEDLDLYCLLSNALTNAMEAASHLPEGERFVTLTVGRERNMAAVHVENPYVGAIELADGLPTSRRDPQYHGFGMRSMVRVVEKYEGSLAVKCEDQIFHLDMLLFEPAQFSLYRLGKDNDRLSGSH